ncbi:Eukaryotic translation initiation factor 2 subunit gamma [Venturia nashicola]|uniref:Eukaryotic translation initiation factor 2 subunit gamma n=1 Tax=Venturia nashicola TaxID=86259 RepID=A0A4Z1PP59_9PEZI|nr:Eukaryotic translation initiation factor 2 subunit gamma [Venturia nashicola]TLD39571.1 Eukaryotic translation initiation factor 2 subunit gamma [Venturia nashicola]
MPYNNTPIEPPKEYSGAVSLPLARVKKIVHADDEIQNCSNNAAFVITIATEMFIQHLVEKTHEIIKAEKRPRRNVQYADVANTVARLDQLEFLSDVVPRTTTYSKYQAQHKRKAEAEAKAAAGDHTRSPTQPSEITTPSIAQASHPPPQPIFTNGGPFAANGHPLPPHPPQQMQHPQQLQPVPMPGQPQYMGQPQPQYAGPSGARVYFNNEDDPSQMDVDRPTSAGRHPIPSTLDMLERARAAQARAGPPSQSPATPQYYAGPPQPGQPQYLQPGQQHQPPPPTQPQSQPQSFGATVNGRGKNSDEKS